MSLSLGETLVFKNKQGVWIEWSEVWYSKIQYAENMWSSILPRDVVLPGMKLSFENDGKMGNFENIGGYFLFI